MADIHRAIQICKILDVWEELDKYAPAQIAQAPGMYKTREEITTFNFLIGSINYGMSSEILYIKIISFLNANPEFGDINHLANLEVTELEKRFRKIGLRFPLTYAKIWIFNSKFINEHSIKYFFTDDVIEFKKRISKLKGFKGQKLGRLLTLFLHSEGLLKFKNLYELGIPIDRHDIRLSQLLGVVDNDNIPEISEIWKQAIKETQTNPAKVDFGLWVIGSQICYNCDKCPLSKLCSKVR